MILSKRQEDCLRYLAETITEKGRAPSLREAALVLGVSHVTVSQVIKNLEDGGYLQRRGNYNRDILLLKDVHGKPLVDRQQMRQVAIIGAITAGLPIYAQEDYDGVVQLDPNIFRADNLFSLRVHGDSMQGAGILSGDLVICEPRQFAENGEIVVALINGDEATVKRFFRYDKFIELRPENDNYQVVQYGVSELLIQGKVVGVLRGPEQFQI